MGDPALAKWIGLDPRQLLGVALSGGRHPRLASDVTSQTIRSIPSGQGARPRIDSTLESRCGQIAGMFRSSPNVWWASVLGWPVRVIRYRCALRMAM